MTNRPFDSSTAIGELERVVPSNVVGLSAALSMVARSLLTDVWMEDQSDAATGAVMLPMVVFGRFIFVNRQLIHLSPDSAIERARSASE